MHLLQVCNVGQIVGGTAACAWSITQSLPQLTHSVAFLSRVDDVTRLTFEPHQILQWPQCTSERVRDINPDLVILHNTAAGATSRWEGAFTIQYVHSAGSRLAADRTVYCSRWLAQQCQAQSTKILWQGVPRPMAPAQFRPRVEGRLRIGRICTPTSRKWPESLPAFYALLATQHPHVDWEFVGCPREMLPLLLEACNGRALFHPAGWVARSHVWNWDALLYHHPTLTESFGRTVAEAARTGCLAIVDDRGGFTEQIEMIGGHLCHSTTEFSEAIESLSNPQTRQPQSLAIRRQADEHFSLTSFGTRLRTLIGDGVIGSLT